MYHDLLPENNLEKEYFLQIAYHLKEKTSDIVSINFGDDYLLDKIKGPKIVIINADERYRIPKCVDDPSVKMVFKQYAHEGQHPKIRPIPLGCKSGYGEYDNKPKEFDFCFIGQVGHRWREIETLMNMLAYNQYHGFVGLYNGFNAGIDVKTYRSILERSKVAICLKGAATPETFRFNESIQAGCITIAPQMPDNWFYRNAPYFPYNQIGEVVDLMRHVYERDNKTYCNDVISPKAVAEYIVRESK